jgi:hypothetical protein
VTAWVTKVRGDATAPIAAEFECPDHGRFELTAPRDQLPDSAPCPRWKPSTADPAVPVVRCGAVSPWCFPSPGAARVKLGEVVQGKVMEYPPEHVCLDTRPLADGMPLGEWRAKQENITRDLGLKRARAMRSR